MQLLNVALIVVASGWCVAACSAPAPSDDDNAGSGGDGGTGGTPTTVQTGPNTGATTTSTNPGGCTTANLTFNDAACSACAENSCCMPLQACDASMSCLDYLGCVQNCGDQACIDTCATTHAEGMALLDALDACLDGSCAAECGGNEGTPICDSGLSVDDEACATCLGTTCCEDVKACEAETSCMGCVTGDAAACDASTLDEAVRDCWDVDCVADCGAAGF